MNNRKALVIANERLAAYGYCIRWNSLFKEYHVRPIGLKDNAATERTYFTDCLEDAINTAAAICGINADMLARV